MTASETPADGRITTERFDRVFAIGIDRPKKLNGFSPKMLNEMAEAYTAFERDDEAWVGVLFAHGANFTAGLELDKVAPVMRERGSVYPVGSVDPLSLRPPIRCELPHSRLNKVSVGHPRRTVFCLSARRLNR